MAVTLTVRLIRSFEYRNLKTIVLHNVDPDMTVQDFKVLVNEEIKKAKNLPPPFKTFNYDTLKIEYKAYGSKTSDPLMNTDNDATLMLEDDKSLKDNGVEHETEITYFYHDDYLKYQTNKEIKW